jgi:Skp family chaperone for outer membrane proteins
MRSKRVLILVSLLAFSAAVFGQQITRIAVMDLSKVIAACSKDSQAVKDFEQKKAEVQADIDRMSADMMRLMAQRADSEKAGDKAAGQKYKDELDARKKALTDFVSAKQAELDAEAKRLGSTDAFSKDLYKQIQNVAETEGYSLVLNLKSGDNVMNSVLWYSAMIDITSDVIQALTKDNAN